MDGAIHHLLQSIGVKIPKNLEVSPPTPLKTNMSPENQWLEDAFPIEMVPFWGTC